MSWVRAKIARLFFAWKLRWKARHGVYSTFTAITWWGNPIMLKEKTAPADWQAAIFDEVEPYDRRAGMLMAFFEEANKPAAEQVIFCHDGIYRIRRATWHDLGYKNAPTPESLKK